MMNYAQNAYKTAGMSANQYMEQSTSFAAALIQSYQGDTEKAANQADKAMRAISDNFNTFGGDIKNVQSAFQGFAKQNYTMLDNLKLGYGGTKTEMERLIADANEYGKSIGRAGDLSINSFADIVEAIDLVQQKQGIAGTTAREAATTISGSVGMVKAAWENLKVAFADGDADLDASFQALADSGKIALNNILPVVEKTITGIGKLASTAVPMIAKEIPKLTKKVLPGLISAGATLVTSIGVGLATAIPDVIEAIPDMISTIKDTFSEAAPMFQEAGNKLMSMLGDGFAKAGQFIGDTIHNLWTNVLGNTEESWQNIADTTKSAWESLKDTFLSSGTELGEHFSGLIDGIKTLFTGLGDFWATWGGTAVTILSSAWELITTTFSLGLDLLSGVFDVFGNLLSGNWAGLWESLKTLGKTAWDGIGSILTTAWNGLVSIGSSIWGLLSGEISNVWNTIKETTATTWENITTSLSTAWDNIKSNVSSAVETVSTNISNVWDNIKSATTSTWEEVKSTVSSKFSEIVSSISSNLTMAWSTVTTIFESIRTSISDKIEAAKTVVSNGVQALKDFFNFDWNLPHIKLPHFSISGTFSLAPPSIPTFSVSWYANGGVFDMPTLFNYGKGQIGGLGEAGAEAVVPLEKNTEWLDRIAERLSEKISNNPVVLEVDGKVFGQIACDSINGLTRQTGRLNLVMA